MFKEYIKWPTVVLLTLAIFAACQDDENNNIPLVNVFIQVNLNEPDFIDLQSVGGSVMITGGSRGIILYRLSPTEIKAYDRHCTFQPSSTCAIVSVDVTKIIASDICCGSEFLLSNGSVTRPPASVPLKAYNTVLNGNFLTITN